MKEDNVKKQIEMAVKDTKPKKLQLADSLGSEADMRKAIQLIADIVQQLLDRISILETK